MSNNSNPSGNPLIYAATNVRVPGAGAQRDSGDRVRDDGEFSRFRALTEDLVRIRKDADEHKRSKRKALSLPVSAA